MSLSALLPAAALEAQGLLAQLQGMDASAEGNFLLGGTPYTGVFGTPQVEEVLHPSGGYRRRTVVPLVAVRSQFSGAPASQQQLVRTDLAPSQTYRIEAVGLDDPLHYTFSLVRVGV